jgi:hypothetical protein
MMLIDRILRAGETANESVGRSLDPEAASLEFLSVVAEL